MTTEYELEIVAARDGFVSFMVVGHPEFGDYAVTLTGQLCNANKILTGAKITLESTD